MMMKEMRGSRRHVLAWTESPNFADELIAMVHPVDCELSPTSIWMPRGFAEPHEARLESFGPRALPESEAWPALRSWWLRHERGANTPNWDIALSCQLDGRPGLVLVEAKAHESELSTAGKPAADSASANSLENHRQITEAITEARTALATQFPGTRIAVDRSYQLSHRVAFAWKLASLGIPTALIYLGFIGDSNMADVGRPFDNDDHWQSCFGGHLRDVCPELPRNQPISTSHAPFWVLPRSLPTPT